MLLKGLLGLFKVDGIAAIRQEYFLEDVLEDFIRTTLQLLLLILTRLLL